MKLTYFGPLQDANGALPLPEGWPASDHEEPDGDTARAKLESGLYREAGVATSPAAEPDRSTKRDARATTEE